MKTPMYLGSGLSRQCLWLVQSVAAALMLCFIPSTKPTKKKLFLLSLSLTKSLKPSIPAGLTKCCTRSAHHGTLFPFLVPSPYFRLRADGRCRAVQARLCRKCCRHVGPYLLSMTSSPSALAAVPGFSSFHFRFAPSDKRTFCHSSLVTLYPAPLLPLDDNGSIAWSVRALVQYI